MRALERLFIFAIVSIASLLVFNLHEKHAELHKRDGEWSVRKDLQQVVEKEKINVFDTNAPRELRKALSEEKLNNYGARVRSGIEEPNERIIDSLRNRIESETGEKKSTVPTSKIDYAFSSSSPFLLQYWASNITKDAQKQDEIRRRIRTRSRPSVERQNVWIRKLSFIETGSRNFCI